MNIKIGAKIKALRKRDDITQEQLAEALGVTNQAISRWESESGYPDIEYITPIANFFNVTTDYLFDHDVAEKRRKIDEYCEQYDAHARDWKSPQERVDMMRQALAEFPAEEKLLFKLAKALYYKWCEYGTTGTWLNGYHGYTQENFNEHRSHDSWEESVKIMEELLLTSVDDQMRSECRQLLAFIYGKIGKKEKLLAILDKCEGIWTCKEVLSAGAMHGYFEDSVKYQQNALVELLGLFKNNITSIARFEVKDINITLRTYEIIIDLYNLVYCDGNFVFYNLTIADLYREYAEILLKQDRVDEAFEVLEKAYAHVKTFDDEVYKKGVIKYTSPFVNFLENNSNENYVVKNLPIFLENLKETTGMYNLKKLYDDPRYTALINKIEKEINEGSE